ncbi:LysR substrate-binding domain-containing protein [Paraburkholderia unamae]|jgi:DNA-binding transcriptional LysR family regulator|uniref:LysR family transcriptional regulator n=1 Tax=Paraburkholderia unamae TaxID=219649 RepID=A0ABX5KLD0_9BURK|nr:LysR substrate-binding domain-containing protein [Paraburkholderia unamae]PVX81645.1 LysR family transcriptional regulator [Paraburkholderia unamae]RAR62642.1 LysR family transcriptional regulator [Paraburkholderia unamae]CAG9274447.1 Transcriptional regulators, LysR family [Paraburkholderia unamae]
MHFDLADIRVFIHVAESSSVTQGARRANLSPAATSARIKALENQLGARLLYRDSRGVTLTPAGEKLLTHARVILRQVDYVKSEFAEYGSGFFGHVRIFANTTAVTEHLPEVLAQFLATRPAVTVDLQERLSREIVRGVLDGSADIGLIAGPVEAQGLEVIHHSTDRLLLALPEGHKLAAKPSVTLAETLDYPHITYREGSTLFDLVASHVENLGRTLPMRIQLASYEAICRMIESGVGIGIIPESAAVRHRKTMRLVTVPLEEPWAIRERSLLVRELDGMPGCVRDLMETLRSG